MTKKMSTSVIVPNWNGVKLLAQNLPLVIASVEEDIEIIIADDASSDNSAEYVRKNFPQVRLITHDKNLGFGQNCNQAVEKAKGELVVLLNSDVVPAKGFLISAIEHFNDPSVFAVSFNEGNWGPGKLVWENGFLEIVPTSLPKLISLTSWANGGSAIYRKDYWLSLGGFSSQYFPFYFEDIDLSMRAYKAGYLCLFEPRARVSHKHESTINKNNFDLNYLNLVKQRNHLLLTWRNIDTLRLFFSHLLNLVKRCLSRPGYLKVVLSTASRFDRKKIKKKKKRELLTFEVLKKFEEISEK